MLSLAADCPRFRADLRGPRASRPGPRPQMTACDDRLPLVPGLVIEREWHGDMLDAPGLAALADELAFRSFVLRDRSRPVANELVHFDGRAHELDQDLIIGHACRVCQGQGRPAKRTPSRGRRGLGSCCGGT